jgi:hypothetical protein
LGRDDEEGVAVLVGLINGKPPLLLRQLKRHRF